MTTPCTDMDPAAPLALQNHLQQCSFAAGGLHRLQCAAERVTTFVAPRLVSVVVMAWLLALALAMAWPFSTP